MSAIRMLFLTVTGAVCVSGGLNIWPASADILHSEDVIIDAGPLPGGLCVGNECAVGEFSGGGFGGGPFLLKDSNIRIDFDDTSTGSFPEHDWSIIINDSTAFGPEFFAIVDATADNQVFRLDAGAPLNSLYVDTNGFVGFGTSTPAQHLHIKTGMTPTLRLDQDGSAGGGFDPQAWELFATQNQISISDVTNGDTIPFRIQAGAPTDAFGINSAGRIGIGTIMPDSFLHIEQNEAGFPELFTLENTGSDFAGFRFKTTGGSIDFNKAAGNTFRLNVVDGDTWELELDPDGNLNIKGSVITGGVTCGGGCDRVFDADYDLPSIEEHAAEMWDKKHLPNVGPTIENQPINLSDKTGRMLNELEKAHIYIAHLNTEKNAMRSEIEDLKSRLSELEKLLSR